MEIITREIPSLQPLGLLTLLPRPRVPIRQRTQVVEIPNGQNNEHSCNLQPDPRPHGRGEEIKHRTRQQDSKVECWEVVVQEKLTLHQEEGEVVQ